MVLNGYVKPLRRRKESDVAVTTKVVNEFADNVFARWPYWITNPESECQARQQLTVLLMQCDATGVDISKAISECMLRRVLRLVREIGLEMFKEKEPVPGDLQDLLAAIHGDGGHHTEKVGLEQSIRDAREVWVGLIEAAEAAGGE